MIIILPIVPVIVIASVPISIPAIFVIPVIFLSGIGVLIFFPIVIVFIPVIIPVLRVIIFLVPIIVPLFIVAVMLSVAIIVSPIVVPIVADVVVIVVFPIIIPVVLAVMIIVFPLPPIIVLAVMIVVFPTASMVVIPIIVTISIALIRSVRIMHAVWILRRIIWRAATAGQVAADFAVWIRCRMDVYIRMSVADGLFQVVHVVYRCRTICLILD